MRFGTFLWALVTAVIIDGAQAGVIDTRPISADSYDFIGCPVNAPSPCMHSSGNFTGGTFVTDSTFVTTFSLYIATRSLSPTEYFDGFGQAAAIILGTDAMGAPTGSPLWMSTPWTVAPGPNSVMTFVPNLHVNLGDLYFVGLTLLTDGYVGGGFAADSILGHSWSCAQVGDCLSVESADVATHLVMSNRRFVSEPSALLLGIFGLAAAVTNRQRARKG